MPALGGQADGLNGRPSDHLKTCCSPRLSSLRDCHRSGESGGRKSTVGEWHGNGTILRQFLSSLRSGRLGKQLAAQGNRAITDSCRAAERHCFNKRDYERLFLLRDKFSFAIQFRSFPATANDICNLVFRQTHGKRGYFTIKTAVSTVIRLEIRHEAWQGPSVTKTRLL